LQEPPLYRSILRAIRHSGAQALLTPQDGSIHPRKFIAVLPEKTIHVWVFVWPLVAVKEADAFRQSFRLHSKLKVFPKLLMNPAGPTLLLGYEPRLDVFAGFSPSLMKNHLPEEVTIRKDLLELARDRGLAFGMKIGGKDVHPLETEGRRSPRNMVVAFAPDQFLHYAESVDEWTECSRDSKALPVFRLIHPPIFRIIHPPVPRPA